MVICSQVHPSRRMIEDRPETRPPRGVSIAVRMPLARVTGISSESGFTATAARTSGDTAPYSEKSVVAETDRVSTRPSVVSHEMSPGYTCRPDASTTRAPARSGGRPESIAVMRPLSKTT